MCQSGGRGGEAEYEPFGNIYRIRAGERLDQPLRFPGQEAAMTWEGTEENYNIFRWYRAGWGRYTQADPLSVAGMGHFAQGKFSRWSGPERYLTITNTVERSAAVGSDVNGYVYAGANPTDVIDPLGLEPAKPRQVRRSDVGRHVPCRWDGKVQRAL